MNSMLEQVKEIFVLPYRNFLVLTKNEYSTIFGTTSKANKIYWVGRKIRDRLDVEWQFDYFYIKDIANVKMTGLY